MKNKKTFTAYLFAGCLIASIAWAIPEKSPEKETLRISKLLKPISDHEWNTITAERSKDQYEVAKGDTLYDISNRLFGDPRYWPKIWAINNGKVTNPHLIYPGKKIAFYPGSGTSLPGVGWDGDETTSDGGVEHSDGEWRQLPQQPWETVSIQSPAKVDPLGFDRRNKISFKKSDGFTLNMLSASKKFKTLGKITAARDPFVFMGLKNIVYVKAEQDLRVGEKYMLTEEPIRLSDEESARVGYSYTILGELQVIGTENKQYIAQITAAQNPIPRGTLLIESLPKVRELPPIPGPKPVEGKLVIDRRTSSSYTTAQYKQSFIDRGTTDGVQPGMIFRAYQRKDPSNSQSVLKSDLVVEADLQVIQASEYYCVATVIRGAGVIDEGTVLVLLTDVSELGGSKPTLVQPEPEITPPETSITPLEPTEPPGEAVVEPPLEPAPLPPPPTEVNELDQLDPGSDLTDEEKRELRQLEQWKKEEQQKQTEPMPTPSAQPEAPPVTHPEDETEYQEDSSDLF